MQGKPELSVLIFRGQYVTCETTDLRSCSAIPLLHTIVEHICLECLVRNSPTSYQA